MHEAGWFDRILFLLGLRKAVRVSGTSMRPTLDNDDVVLVRTRFRPAIGDIVLVEHPYKRSVTMLKRIGSATESDRFGSL